MQRSEKNTSVVKKTLEIYSLEREKKEEFHFDKGGGQISLTRRVHVLFKNFQGGQGFSAFGRKFEGHPLMVFLSPSLLQESIIKIKGPATECRKICPYLGLPSLMANEIKQGIKKRKEECMKRMQDGSKSKDRVDLNPDETQYLQRLLLSNCRVYFKYRSRCIAMVKMN